MTVQDPAPRRTRQRRFDRSELIVDAAAEIFRRKGYDATSLQEIADEVGILKGSMYHYIATKEDLLFAIINRNHERIIAGNQGWREHADDPVAALRSFIEGHLRNSLANRTDSVVFVRDFRALSEERAASILRAQHAYDQDFRTLVAAALAAGALRGGVSPAFAARAVFGMANWIHYWFDPAGALEPEDVVRELSTYALASLLEGGGLPPASNQTVG
ncbi:TetR/AcrR family transcriptional regulator [Nocardioides zeae]|uniref:TetR/AcrR family transcriptional regulator n=1 Tax=Nocardioides imazamoxiresistens TaxID=3231893 RepID=A0ABU3PSA1_9ACTN|nr:TetR/AcrR family transcriptional regulator [Nocardioides zeae]MDT9591660.1 TetR/AcrR family transcriptional regulator [Nocardioides zeae]